jgi:hypothetical protein
VSKRGADPSLLFISPSPNRLIQGSLLTRLERGTKGVREKGVRKANIVKTKTRTIVILVKKEGAFAP